MRNLTTGFSKAPFAVPEILYGLEEAGFVEIGPENRGKIEFGIGYLPKKKIADAKFPSGSD